MQANRVVSIREFQLPKTVDLERQLLADIVASPQSIGDVMRFVTEDAFTTDSRKNIWRTVVSLFNRGEVVDMVTMLDVCGDAFVTEVLTPGLTGDTERMAVQHSVHLRDAAARRRGYFAAVNMLRATTENERGIEDICAIAENLGREVQGEAVIVNEVPLADVLKTIDAELAEKRRMKQEGKRFRVPTGIDALDWNTYQGWGPGQLIVLAARPSVGKTALMLKFARSAAEAGFPVDIFSLEMTKEELGQRLLYSTGEVQPTDINTGFVIQDRFDEACASLKKLDIQINDTSRSLEEIVARLSINVRAGRCKVGFIDYLGLMNVVTGYRENVNQAIARITGELKALAKRLRIPIILLCQLNRDVVRGDRAPELYDLRDSGAIEQDADIVMMLENEKAINPDTGLRDIKIWLRKNRQYKRDVCIRISPNKTYSDFKEVGVYDNQDIELTEPDEEPKNNNLFDL